MAVTKTEIVTNTYTDENGQVHSESTTKETSFEKSQEPDYIKIYTNMWCEFKSVPAQYRQLFLSLAIRMSYTDKTDLEHSQLVFTGKPFTDDIMKECGWNSRISLQKGLKALCECNAIKHMARGVYQINPSYAGRGSWNYNPKEGRGGIKDLVAKFNFREGTVETNIVWADDGTDTEENRRFREQNHVTPKNNTVITHTSQEG